MITVERLAEVPILAPLDEDGLRDLLERGSERRLAAGDCLFREGEPASLFQVLIEGELETTRDVDGDRATMMIHRANGHLGAIALLTDTPYRGTTHALTDALIFELAGEDFHRLVLTHPALLRSLLQVFAPVMGTVQGLARDRERVQALGTLAAGLAHELNNPASAAARAADAMKDYETLRQGAMGRLVMDGASTTQLGELLALTAEAASQTTSPSADPLERSDREEDLLSWLAAQGAGDCDDLAYLLADGGLSAAWAERTQAIAGGAHLVPALRLVGACAAASVLLSELREATTRISGLVEDVRRYSYLDQDPHQTINVHEGIESTLSVLAHRFSESGIEVVRDFAPDLPQIEASGPELNQVWTNLVANAIDALDGAGGTLTITTRRLAGRIQVEVADDGPGIPQESLSRVFDAFFTTKDVGQGTGLGLDIARRVVLRHHGEVGVESRPGHTAFRVILPA